MIVNNTNTIQDPPKRFIDFPEARYRTCLGKTALYELIKKGELKPIKLGRKTVFLESDILAWINKKAGNQTEVAK